MLLLFNCLQKVNAFLYEVGIIFTAVLCFLPLIIKHQKTLHYIWITLCTFLMVFNVNLIAMNFHKAGWDFNVYCAAVKVFENNGNPYLVNEVQKLSGNSLPFIYPPISIFLFKTFCYLNSIFNVRISYHILWCIFILGIFFIIKKGDKCFSPLLLVTLLLSGFLATFWNFFTGNIGLFELLLLSVCFYFVIKGKYYLAMFPLTLIALLKIIPLALIGIFILSGITKSSRLKVLLFGVLLFIFFSSLSYFLFPDITHSYYLSLMGKLGKQISPIYEKGGISNPSTFYMVKSVSEMLFGNNFIVSLTIYILLIAFIFAIFLDYVLKNDRDFLDILSAWVLFFLIVSPRLKPYSFAFALIPVYFLIKDFTERYKFLAIFIVSVIPLLRLRLYSFFAASTEPLFILGNTIFDYNQSICLLIFFIFTLLYDRFKIKLVKNYV